MNDLTFTLRGVDFLKEVEGFKLQPYKDSAGKLTIGVGHLLTVHELSSDQIVIDGQAINWRNGISEEQVNSLLMQDIKPAADAVNGHVKVQLTQYQFDALVSFTFNVGVGAFELSTLLKLLNAGNTVAAAGQFLHWVSAGGRVVQGLINRRNKEHALFLGEYESNN